MEVLSNVWRAFLFIAESALKVAFKSEYLQLFQAQQVRGEGDGRRAVGKGGSAVVAS